MFSNPEGIKVNSRGRALRDAHGGSEKRFFTLKGSNSSGNVTLSGTGIFPCLPVGVAQRSLTAINLHPSGMWGERKA